MSSKRPRLSEAARGRLLTLALAAGSTAAALLFVEAFLRVFLPQERSTPYLTVRHGHVYGHPPNSTIVHRSRHFDVTYRINGDGFRGPDREYEKPEGVFRIVSLGDSFTFGHGVADDKTYSALIERALNAWTGKPEGIDRFEVLNLGAPGIGLAAHEYLYFKIGLRYDPDLILLSFYSNDLDYEFGDKLQDLNVEHIERASLTRIQRIRSLARRLPAYRWLCEHSHAWSFARRNLSRLVMLSAERATDKALNVASKEERQMLQQRKAMARFGSFIDHACATDRRLALLSTNHYLSQFTTLYEHLRERALGSNCFRMLPVSTEKAHAFGTDDPHWTEEGHARVAETILDGLKPVIRRRN